MDFPIRELAVGEWPPLIKEMNDPPERLRIRGSLPETHHKLLAVVGSRKFSAYGKEAARSIILGLGGYEVTIVSGLAIGIDAVAHEAALEAKLHTIAVPGSGLSDSALYPRSNRKLAERILSAGGALLSEFDDDFRAIEWSFPARNRIMAGMSHATLVVEARKKSGTLITARLAADYNRDVLAIPGSIFSEGSFGPHMLIRLGATPVTSAHDVLDALHIEEKGVPEISRDHTPLEEKVFLYLSEPRDRETLITMLGFSAQEMNILLANMELKSLITEYNGQFRRR